jgi:hypothetical protein
MEKYREYLDSISVDSTQHQRIMELINKKPQIVPRYAGLAACLAVLAVCVWVMPRLLDTPTINNPIIISPGIPTENITDGNTIVAEADTLVPDLPVVFHDLDPALIISRGTAARVPYGFFFTHKLALLANNETGITMNNGVRWDSAQFERLDIDHVLPNGDCVFEQSILFDVATETPIAYKNTYIYFTLETMEFQREFSIFSFSLDDFGKRDSAELEQSENITYENGEIAILDFPAPVVNASSRIPHRRTLVYFNNGAAIVIEAITAPTFIGDVFDEAGSLEKYEQSDRELINIMRSLITQSQTTASHSR